MKGVRSIKSLIDDLRNGLENLEDEILVELEEHEVLKREVHRFYLHYTGEPGVRPGDEMDELERRIETLNDLT